MTPSKERFVNLKCIIMERLLLYQHSELLAEKLVRPVNVMV